MKTTVQSNNGESNFALVKHKRKRGSYKDHEIDDVADHDVFSFPRMTTETIPSIRQLIMLPLPHVLSFVKGDETHVIELPPLLTLMDKNYKHIQLDSRGVELLEPLVLLANEIRSVPPQVIIPEESSTPPPAFLIDSLLLSLRS